MHCFTEYELRFVFFLGRETANLGSFQHRETILETLLQPLARKVWQRQQFHSRGKMTCQLISSRSSDAHDVNRRRSLALSFDAHKESIYVWHSCRTNCNRKNEWGRTRKQTNIRVFFFVCFFSYCKKKRKKCFACDTIRTSCVKRVTRGVQALSDPTHRGHTRRHSEL